MYNSFTAKTGSLFLATFLLTVSSLLAQGIRGRVTDKAGGAAIPGATIVVVGTNIGATTDANGNYQIKVGAGTYSIATSFVGYKTTTQPAVVPPSSDVEVNASLAESTDNLSEVVIIGSRAATARTNVQTVAPVDVITAKEMKSFSQIDVGQILNFVAPSFNSNRQTVADGTDHVDPASLRGLGPDQVLVLVNGKRRHTSALLNINGTVGRGSVGTDMNVIPVAAIERIEVLRDGAAAQYGSDAIAGVINVVLKKDYTGLTASLTGGQNMTTLNYASPVLGGGTKNYSQSLTDGQVLQFDISKGFRLGQKGYLTVSGQYNDRGRSNRSGYDNAPTIYLGASGGFPGTPTGQVQNDFRTKLIADDAMLVQQRNYNRQNMIIGNSASQNVGVFINGSLPVGKNGEIYAAGGITYRKGTGYGNNRIPVSRSQQPLNADGSLFYPDGFLPGIGSTVQDQSLIAGFKTRLGALTMDLIPIQI